MLVHELTNSVITNQHKITKVSSLPNLYPVVYGSAGSKQGRRQVAAGGGGGKVRESAE